MLALALQTAAPQTPAAAPPPDETTDRPIQQFFQNLGRDMVALPSRDTAILIGSGVVGGLVFHPVDDNLREWADGKEPSGYTPIGRSLGDGWVQGGAALGTYGIGLFAEHPMMTHIGSDLIRAQALNAVLTRGLKFASQRRRPSGGHESLPSGHASASFASAAVLDSHFGPRVGIPAYAVAGFIGWTRVRDNAHWLTDVVVGAAIGAAVGRTVTAGHRDRDWTIVPVASANEVAIYFVRIGN